MLEKIKADTLAMRKAKDPLASKMVTLQSAIVMIAKNDGNRETTDEDVVRAVRQFVKGAEETRNHQIANNLPIDDVNAELKMYRKYLPEEMSDKEIEVAVAKTIADVDASSPKDMGKVMAALKQNYGTAINMKAAGAIVKQSLA